MRLQTLKKLTPTQITGRIMGKVFGEAAEHHYMDRVLNIPSPFWSLPYAWKRFTPAEGEQLIRDLRADGIVVIPGFFDAPTLARVKAAVEAAFTPTLAPSMKFRENGQFYACLQPLAMSSDIAEAAIDHDLINLSSAYFRKYPFMSEADFRRVLPIDMAEHEKKNEKFGKGHSSSHWHYDMRGRQIKVMTYLTDVTEKDQNFAFCKGSHTGFKSHDYTKSRFSDGAIDAKRYEIMECYAKAGTAIVFDTNGLHRLRRRKAERNRDSVTFNYHPGKMYRVIPQQVHASALRSRRDEFARILELE